ncbi:bifunctional O-acetylhomoserine aminocarboxypropyltransferase/cysteine synthase [Streptomyces sp. WAC 01529]|uniref:O-acetylhomoserine aminocarboxypropyltransferase/cysteine synthase family protein n=1 Tax=Streptomyces sp. WAC 01529 TaxID=2203205 RepID=UPI000F6D72F9|nr:O-acetylhomoserine aminocarboxypropyltransferase/cysteine synthase family protein [Streptomyces sp. WAC 01529]AZM55255.1 bifunctional O-acetylhomoserine aminocarboxypropyltransferase/cysteine synthase [Streptomyces sp. WAC 01529]
MSRPEVPARGKTFRAAETAAIHGGYEWRLGITPPVVTPIYQTSAYELPSTADAAGIFDLQQDGHAYTRLNNPTCDVLEERMAAVDGAAAGLAVASGQAAISLALLNLCQAGDNIVSSNELYGGTWNLLANTFKRFGIETRFVSPSDPKNFAAATDERTRCYFGETLPNPRLSVFPIEAVAELGEQAGVPLILDNTMVPYVCRPIEHGAHILVYSATKYIGGHGSTLGGLILDSGLFDWEAHADRHPLLTQPDAAHGGAVWTRTGKDLDSPLGRSSYLLKARETLLRDLGPCLSPFNAWLLLQGLETLHLRMRAHGENATAVAGFLASHPKVGAVRHPSLASGEEARLAARYFGGNGGPLVQFELTGGREAGCRFIESLQLISHVTNVGDVRSLATHPASTTHAQLPEQEQLAAGVTQGSIRLAVGVEHIDDLLADLGQALDGS